MATRVRTAPRKIPSQERSRASVEAILAATARILVTDGYDRASTNQIAARAGVSVGSLYQYFPNKEALVATLIDRHTQRMLRVLEEKLSSLDGADPQRAIRELILAMVLAHRVEPRLHAVLTEQIPNLGRLQRLRQVNRSAAEMIRSRLQRMKQVILPENIDLAVFILVHAVEAVTHAMVVDEPEGFDVEALVDELSALVFRYLFGQSLCESRSLQKGARALSK